MTRVGFFAGSFDPPTLGHLELVMRAAAIVDKLVIGVGANADKTAWLSLEERLALLAELLPAGTVAAPFSGLAVEAARRAGAGVLLRGVRSEADLAVELQMALANRKLAPDLETVVLVGSPEVAHISSRLVREVYAGGGDVGHFVPPLVAQFLKRRRAAQGAQGAQGAR